MMKIHLAIVTTSALQRHPSSARRASIGIDHRPRVSTRHIKGTSDTECVLSVHERDIDIVQRPKSTASVTPTTLVPFFIRL